MKPKLLDLFCCEGGAGKGYTDAGFEVTGVDVSPQPRYPHEFIQGDALEYLAMHGHKYDAIHASPPCQAYSKMTPYKYRSNHPDLIGPVRELLQQLGKPYVIENVPNARHLLRSPMMLCGSMFGLPIERHRYFECYPTIRIQWGERLYCRHISNPILITDHGGPNANGPGKPRKRSPVAVKRTAMQMEWATEAGLSEAVPPVFTCWIGTKLLQFVHR